MQTTRVVPTGNNVNAAAVKEKGEGEEGSFIVFLAKSVPFVVIRLFLMRERVKS